MKKSETGKTTGRSRSKKKPEAQKTAAGQTAADSIEIYKQRIGKAIMRPDGNRAYMPTNLWQAPIWLPENRASRTKKFPLRWTDQFGNKYEVNGSEEIKANPDMGVLLGLVAIFQDYMLEHDIFYEKISGLTYIGITIPISHVYKATGYTYRSKQRLLESIKRLQTLSVEIKFAKNDITGGRGIIFAKFFDAYYVEPESNGKAGQIKFVINRFFIPRPVGYIWHPAKLCQSLQLSTSRLIFWATACNIHGWKGTARDLYQLVNRLNATAHIDIDATKVRKWKARRLQPALDELAKHGFRITKRKNAYDEEEICIYWPPAKKALTKGTETIEAEATVLKDSLEP